MTPEQKRAIAGAKRGVTRMFGTGSGAGPLEKFRDKKPADIDQDEWDSLLDDLNEQMNETGSFKGAFGLKQGKFGELNANEVERWTIDDVLAAGKRSGHLGQNRAAKRDDTTELTGAARNQINENNRRQLLYDQAMSEANAQDQADLTGLRGAQGTASQAFHDTAANVRRDANTANQNSRDLLAGLGKDFQALNTQDQNQLANYLASTDPYMKEVMARTSDPADVQRQLDAYAEQQGVADKYKGLTDPQVTAQERFLSEVLRRQFESADLSNRKAIGEQLANRGLRSGGQEIAMNQQARQQLAQDRMLNELGIQSKAVDRSMKAMEGWQSATAALSTAAGTIRTANDTQRQWEDEFKVNEAERVAGLAGERKTASDATTKTVGERDQKYADTGLGVERDTYGRNKDANTADWQVGEKDYGMAGDYYDASTGTSGRRVTRAGAGLDSGIATGGTNLNILSSALGLKAKLRADEDELDIANDYGA